MTDPILAPLPAAAEPLTGGGGLPSPRWRAWLQRLDRRVRRPPAFAAYLSATANDVTGDGTLYAIAPDAVLFDTAGSFAGGLFRAPADGLYQINGTIVLAGVAAAHNRIAPALQVLAGSGAGTEARSYGGEAGDVPPDVDARVTLRLAHLVRMLAGNTARLTVQVEGSTKVVDVVGGAPDTVFSTLSGFLVATG
ncbi:MAG: hypothetical protein IT534_02115 [Bauldia sp.]|nr:hypothetical protein [Bauldia sp.]